MWRTRASTSSSSRVAFTVPVRLSSRQRLSLMLPSMTHRRCGRASPGAVGVPGSSVTGAKRRSPSSRYSQVASDSSTCASTSMRNMAPPSALIENYSGCDFEVRQTCEHSNLPIRLLHGKEPVKVGLVQSLSRYKVQGYKGLQTAPSWPLQCENFLALFDRQNSSSRN